jgi:DNA-binding Lrp family transcriptional regulator
MVVMDGWWNEIDTQIEKALFRTGSMTPADLAREVGLSEAATVSVLSRLATEGRIRIARVEIPAERASRVAAA